MLEEGETANYTGAMRIFIGEPAVEASGTLIITTSRVVWMPSNGQQRVQGFSLFYQAIAMHAVSRDTSDFPHPCLYVQQHGQSAALAVPELGSRTSSGRA